MNALEKYHDCGGDEEPDPLERLRFFYSLALSRQNWLDVEPFFDALKRPQTRAERFSNYETIEMGFVIGPNKGEEKSKS